MYLPKVVMVMVVFYGYISIILSAAVPALSSQNYGNNNFDTRRSNLLATPRNLPRTSPSSSGYTHDVVPKPYKFNYFIVDDQGNTHHRDEESNGNGTVKGYYGYTDISGLFRIVEYTADRNGFRASIKTNEPTLVGRKSPADVRLNDYPSATDMRNENEPWKYSENEKGNGISDEVKSDPEGKPYISEVQHSLGPYINRGWESGMEPKKNST